MSEKQYEYDLSIVFITMNRKKQLIEAIDSCIESDLPERCEFIIIDNGSCDGTEDAIREYFADKDVNYIFDRQEENLGIGGGRNAGIKRARGRFIYILDDDAVISEKSQADFFSSALAMFDDPRVGGITTSVYDKCLKRHRLSKKARKYSSDLPMVFMLHGNTHFLRNGIDGVKYCQTIKYGFEDMYMSIRILDAGYLCVLNERVETIHKPLVNKWIPGSEELNDIILKGVAGILTAKYILYPRVFVPILYLTALLRCVRYFGFNLARMTEMFKLVQQQIRGVSEPKVKYATVFCLIKQFGLISAL